MESLPSSPKRAPERNSKESGKPAAAKHYVGMRPKDLMRAMGSQDGAFAPEPPDHYLKRMGKEETQVQRVVSWMKAHTIHVGHRSPFACRRNQPNRPLTLNDMAVDLFNGDWSNAERAWQEAENLGFVRREEKRLYLCAEIRPKTEAKKKETRPVCTDWLPNYIANQMNELTNETKQKLLAQLEALEAWPLEAEAIALARAQKAQVQHSILTAAGIRIRQSCKKSAQPQCLKLKLIAAPEPIQEFIQVSAAEPAHSTPSQSCTQQPQMNSVQTGLNQLCTPPVTLLPYRAIEHLREQSSSSASGIVEARNAATTTTSPAPDPPAEAEQRPPAPPAPYEVPEIVAALEQYAPAVDDQAVRQLILSCRQECPDCTLAEMIHFIGLKGRTSSKKGVSNPLGFLLKAVPACFRGHAFAQFRLRQKEVREQEARAAEQAAKHAEALERELAEQEAHEEAQRRELLAHPERCERCKGQGRYGPGRRYACNCPAGQKAMGGAQ